jgi:glucose/mannose-6-phosphate isomerase
LLDDLKYIHERDANDALGIAEKQASQLIYTSELQGNREFGEILNVVYAGMGGSALAASLVHTWPKLSVPFEVVRDYDLPPYVGEKTLVIAASYSGNTEETLSALEQAEAKGAQIAVIAGGGKLREAAASKGYLLGTLPNVVQPRYVVLSNLKVLLDILAVARLLKEDVTPELQQTSTFLQNAIQAWLPTVPASQNRAKQIALEAIGKSVVIYGGPNLYPAAYKWKISFNENAKQIAWAGQYPEFNHNEFIGWSKQPVDKPYLVIDLRSNLEHQRVQKRFEVSERLLSGMRPAPEIVIAEGQTILEQLVWTIALGDFVTLYTAIANGLNPAPVDLVEKFKKELTN